MPYNNMKGSIPEALGDLEQLTFLELYQNRLTGVVPSLPFKNYTNGCYLQYQTTNPTNHYTCPLPPVSPLAYTTCAICPAPALPVQPLRAHAHPAHARIQIPYPPHTPARVCSVRPTPRGSPPRMYAIPSRPQEPPSEHSRAPTRDGLRFLALLSCRFVNPPIRPLPCPPPPVTFESGRRQLHGGPAHVRASADPSGAAVGTEQHDQFHSQPHLLVGCGGR
jgi:hypothetical protein